MSRRTRTTPHVGHRTNSFPRSRTNATAKRTRRAQGRGSFLNARGNILSKISGNRTGALFKTTRRPPTKNAACLRRVGASFPVRRRPKAGGSGLCELFFLCRHGGGEAITQRLENGLPPFLCPRGSDTPHGKNAQPSSRLFFAKRWRPPVSRHLPTHSPRISLRRPAQGSAEARGVHPPGRMFRKPERRNHARACHLVCGP